MYCVHHCLWTNFVIGRFQASTVNSTYVGLIQLLMLFSSHNSKKAQLLYFLAWFTKWSKMSQISFSLTIVYISRNGFFYRNLLTTWWIMMEGYFNRILAFSLIWNKTLKYNLSTCSTCSMFHFLCIFLHFLHF